MPALRARVTEQQRALLGPRPREREALDASRTFVAYAQCLAEALAAGRAEASAATVTVREPRVLEQLQSEQGAVIVTAHAGAWDAAGPLLARDLGRKVTVLMHAEPDARARRLHDSVRRGAGVEVLHVGDDPLSAVPLLARLKRGELVAAQIDRAPPNLRRIETRLGEAPFAVPAGPFVLAGLAGVPLLPLFARRAGPFRYELWGGAPVRVARRAREAELRAAADEVMRTLERFLRAHPTQWFCFGDS